MLQLAQAADDSIEAINVPMRTIEGRFTRHRTRPKPRAWNVSCRSSPHPTLPSRPFPRWSRKLDEIRICASCGRELQHAERTMVRPWANSSRIAVAAEL
jgi:hypothetical protein